MSAQRLSSIRNAMRALPKGVSFLVAVSGGIDSIALLNALVAEKGFLRAQRIEVAHVDHGLRRTSSIDTRFVQKFSKQLGVRCHIKKLRPTKKILITHGGTEQWGRVQRYAFFESLRKKYSIDYIVTAHQANDEAETFLMRLLSDKDTRRGVVAYDAGRHILRPLLSITRASIEEYAKEHHLDWRDDPTNADNVYLRNKVRNKILPVIESTIGKGVVESLSHRAAVQKADWDLLQKVLEGILAPLCAYPSLGREWVQTLKEILALYDEHMRARLVEKAFSSICSFSLGVERSRMLDQFLHGSGKYLALCSGYTVEKRAGAMILHQG